MLSGTGMSGEGGSVTSLGGGPPASPPVSENAGSTRLACKPCVTLSRISRDSASTLLNSSRGSAGGFEGNSKIVPPVACVTLVRNANSVPSMDRNRLMTGRQDGSGGLRRPGTVARETPGGLSLVGMGAAKVSPKVPSAGTRVTMAWRWSQLGRNGACVTLRGCRSRHPQPSPLSTRDPGRVSGAPRKACGASGTSFSVAPQGGRASAASGRTAGKSGPALGDRSKAQIRLE
jgi:hypothetical protein